MLTLPDLALADDALRGLDPARRCGMQAIWEACSAFNVPFDLATMWQVSSHKQLPEMPEGTYPIGVAVALAHAGLHVTFSTDPDPEPADIEVTLYSQAQGLGVRIIGGQPLVDIVRDERLVIIAYNPQGDPFHSHIATLVGIRDGRPVWPNELMGFQSLSIEELEALRGVRTLRQCVVVESPLGKNPHSQGSGGPVHPRRLE